MAGFEQTCWSEIWTSTPSTTLDSRRLEVVVDGLSLFGGAQLAIDTTLVSPLSLGTGLHGHDVPLLAALRWIGQEFGKRDAIRSSQVTMGGHAWSSWQEKSAARFSSETAQFLRCLASDKVRSTPLILKGRIHAALIRRWSAMLGCSAARSYALSPPRQGSPLGLMAPVPQRMRCLGMTGMLVSCW